nr:hypothetical protein [uncultured Flavobacterium sp.]
MKKTILFFLLLLTFGLQGQNLTEKQLSKLETFGIPTKNFDYNNEIIQANLKLILLKDKKRKTNLVTGIVFSSLAIATTAFGAKIIDNSKNDQEGVGQAIGSMFVVGGIIELGISVPFYISSHKRKKERDNIIEIYQSPSNH